MSTVMWCYLALCFAYALPCLCADARAIGRGR